MFFVYSHTQYILGRINRVKPCRFSSRRWRIENPTSRRNVQDVTIPTRPSESCSSGSKKYSLIYTPSNDGCFTFRCYLDKTIAWVGRNPGIAMSIKCKIIWRGKIARDHFHWPTSRAIAMNRNSRVQWRSESLPNVSVQSLQPIPRNIT